MAKGKEVFGRRSDKRYLKLTLTEKEAYMLDCVLANIAGYGDHRERLIGIQEVLDDFLGGDNDDTDEREEIRYQLAEQYPEIDISWDMVIQNDGVGEPSLMFRPLSGPGSEVSHEEASVVDDRVNDAFRAIFGPGFSVEVNSVQNHYSDGSSSEVYSYGTDDSEQEQESVAEKFRNVEVPESKPVHDHLKGRDDESEGWVEVPGFGYFRPYN